MGADVSGLSQQFYGLRSVVKIMGGDYNSPVSAGVFGAFTPLLCAFLLAWLVGLSACRLVGYRDFPAPCDITAAQGQGHHKRLTRKSKSTRPQQ